MSTESTANTEITQAPAAPRASISERVFGGDKALWIVIAILTVISIPVILSSTMTLVLKNAEGNTLYYLTRQIMFIMISFGVVWIVHRIDYQVYAKYSHILLYISLGLVVLAYFFGVNLNDANRWLPIPGTGFTFQPSDMLKVSLIMVLARELSKRQATIKKTPLFPVMPLFHAKFSEKRKKQNRRIWRETTIPLLGPIIVSCLAIFMSGFSTAVLTFVTCMVMLYIGRVRVGELWRLVRTALIVVSLLVVVMYQFDIGRSGTWKSRVETFLGVGDPADSDDDLQIREAKVAVAKGGLTGTGPGLSTQKAKLPHSYSDFAFAFIVEEYGLLGGVFVLALYLWLFFRTIVIFGKCERLYPSLLVLGLGLLIVFQAFTNIMVSVGLLPVTGQTLPLISLGGSSMVFTSLALGMILGVSRQMQEHTLGTVREDGAK